MCADGTDMFGIGTQDKSFSALKTGGVGGAKSLFWQQMISNVFGIPLTDMSLSGGAALGAAILGGVAGGVWKDVVSATDEVIKKGATVIPLPDSHELYKKYHELYKKLYSSLKENYKELSAI